ncbi:MAG TPA: phosphatidylglycerophosphatase A [Dongiaceae bacterium]|nr:phosphatidylglycerophosphatase A [Dongiaceae bacterium]
MNRFARVLATLGPVGSFPIAPATLGSLVTVLVGYLLPVPDLRIALAILMLGFFVAVWAAGEAEKTLGHDAGPIVIDEVIGQTIALLGAPHVWWAFLGCFVLFRVFDVWKPFGAHEAQRLPGGWGVVTDDVIAGVVSCIAFQLGRMAVLRLGA